MPPALLGKLRTLLGGRESNGSKKVIHRDPRYVIQGSLIYRPTGGMDWYRGDTENLSHSGVLFTGDTAVPLNTTIEMSITPPKKDRKIVDGVFCWGKVVRTTSSADPAKPALAAKIIKYRSKPKYLTDADIHYERMA